MNWLFELIVEEIVFRFWKTSLAILALLCAGIALLIWSA